LSIKTGDQEIVVTYQNGLLQSFDDNPAVIDDRVDRLHELEWRDEGKLHRSNDKPANISYNGLMWAINGFLHRVGKPAELSLNGALVQPGCDSIQDGWILPIKYTSSEWNARSPITHESWLQYGKLHNSDGCAYLNWIYGSHSWAKDGKLHRLEGPALFACESRYGMYFIDGQQVTENGHAI
jgi:hypothetical protein